MNLLQTVFGILNRINSGVAQACTWLGTILLMILASVVIVGVFARFVLNMPFGWSEELPKYCMVWITFVGAPAVMYHASHVAVDGWYGAVPERLRHALYFLGSLVCCVILAIFVSYGWDSALRAQNQKIIIMNKLSMFWVYLSVPLGSALFLYAFALRALKSLILFFAPQLDAMSALQYKHTS